MSKYDVVLTAYCLTYNHENYIEKTLQGFVSQKTNFRFKVIVHDDASTDKTAEIVRQYAEKYQDIIYPIFQKENQYSQHIPIFNTYIKPELEGKYIAVCEGDDYWCDPNKLQMQYDYMETHPECALCVHNTQKITTHGEKITKVNLKDIDVDYTTDDIIIAGSAKLFQTSSFFAKTEFFITEPQSFKIKGIGDYPLSIWLSICGNHVHYIGKTMSVYRVGTPGSWSDRHKSKEKQIEYRENIIKALKQIDEYTEFRFHKSFLKDIAYNEYKIIGAKKTYQALLNPKYWGFLRSSIVNKLRKIFNCQTV